MKELDQGCHPDAKIINQACKKTKNNTCTYATKLNWGGYPNPKKHKLRIQKICKNKHDDLKNDQGRYPDRVFGESFKNIKQLFTKSRPGSPP